MGSGNSKSSSRAERIVARGFTLIEILVALTIVAVALMASMRAAGSLTVSATELRKRTLAQWSAENHLAQIRIERGELPALGRRAFQCDQGDLPLRCEQDVQSTANPLLRRVDVQVYDASVPNGQRIARLIGFATSIR